ncbi:hypothetical protein ZOSMA_244G00030 [Zostera marina]|uniref:hAT-like transposase RNase-H fold domain-containing protein n=1 Tax=Zostera marina TaxID=29655 RepID=A0A0K9PJ51_ZOSMR|nr:hypothetical protein ZOSMA_244G00030 [Zostera marina]
MNVDTSKALTLDVATRWNSTYLMLESALLYKDVFRRYKEYDLSFTWLPTEEEWESSEKICEFLSYFYDATLVFSGTTYPTSNLFFYELWKLNNRLNKGCIKSDQYIHDMSWKMKEKYDKYWGNAMKL